MICNFKILVILKILSWGACHPADPSHFLKISFCCLDIEKFDIFFYSGGGICGISMGCLDDGRFTVELENGMKIDCSEVGLEEQGKDGSAIEDAVKVLLLGLGEDINREGIRRTPLRVAKALREGTRGKNNCFFLFLIYTAGTLLLHSYSSFSQIITGVNV